MRGISFLAGIAAAAFMASSAQSASTQSASTQSASTTSLRAECQRIAPPGHACVLGRVMDDHTILVLVTTEDLPTDRPSIWVSAPSQGFRPIPMLDRFMGRLVMVSGDWTDGALFHGRMLMVPTYGRRKH